MGGVLSVVMFAGALAYIVALPWLSVRRSQAVRDGDLERADHLKHRGETAAQAYAWVILVVTGGNLALWLAR